MAKIKFKYPIWIVIISVVQLGFHQDIRYFSLYYYGWNALAFLAFDFELIQNRSDECEFKKPTNIRQRQTIFCYFNFCFCSFIKHFLCPIQTLRLHSIHIENSA